MNSSTTPGYQQSEAQKYMQTYADMGEDVALRVYTTRLLGRDPSLVLHGGGNTSVKTTMPDELGRPVQVLCVKGSGWDMGEIEPVGLPAVTLAPIQDFRALDQLSDEAMVNGVRRHLLNTASPTPSVETLLHAFIPEKFIDHTHADAVLALVDQPNASELCRQIYGDSMGIVPYIMPGFLLSKKAVEIYEQNPEVEGLLLINHGIFTFGPTAEIAYERMMRHVATAERYQKQAKPQAVVNQPEQADDDTLANALASLRTALINSPDAIGPQILHHRNSPAISAFLQRTDLLDVAQRGTATPDHVIRTKKKPLIISQPKLNDAAALQEQIDTALSAYCNDYRNYFKTQVEAKGVTRTQLHPLPPVILIPGIGLVTAGRTAKETRISADIYEHTIDIINRAETIGRYQPLPDDHLFDMEYWSLEQAKLGKKKPAELAGRVTLITGAASGIGRATALRFAAAGSNLMLADLNQAGLEETAAACAAHGVRVDVQITDVTIADQVKALVRQTVLNFGGLDAVVSNAGNAPSGPMSQSSDLLERSIQLNLLSHQYVAAAAFDLMQNTGGCLLFNASKSAFNPGPGFGPYSVPKAAVIALMKQYAVEGAPYGIRSSAVNADRIRTSLFDENLVKTRAAARGLTPDQYWRANLLKQEVLAEDVAEAFFQLYRFKKTTGAVLPVDGGNIAASPR